MNADYEEMLLQITDVLKAHNRHHLRTPDHEQAVSLIRDIVIPQGEWLHDIVAFYQTCSNCRKTLNFDFFDDGMEANFCPNCGARMGGKHGQT